MRDDIRGLMDDGRRVGFAQMFPDIQIVSPLVSKLG